MKETLRILFSAAFLSTVFLCAYNYVNSSADDRQNSLSSFFGDSSEKQGDESAPADDSFQFGSSDSFSPPPVQSNQNSQPSPFSPAADNASLPLLPPESQQAAPSAPYGLAAPTVTENNLPPNESPIIEPLTPDVPSPPNVAPIDPVAPIAPIAPDGSADVIPVTQDVNQNNNLPNQVMNPPAQDSEDRAAVAAFIAEAHQRINRGEILPTLFKLSQYYNAPQFTPEEAKQVHYMLMQLAGEVIYLHPEKYFNLYTVQPGDTITSIAGQHQVPWQFIAKINGMTAPYHVNPGEQLKVVRGPFNAEIHLDRYELTLWLPVGTDSSQSLYAGTFPIGLGGDCPKLQGDYIVDEKFINPEYPKFSQNPTTFGPGDANNPYGSRLLALTCVNDQNHVKIGIHGTNNPQYIRQSVPYGFICLGARDINDLYDILSVGSRIKIER